MSTDVANILSRLSSSVAVLFGGSSQEREVSLNSGTAVLKALEGAGIPCLAIDTVDDWITTLREQQIKHALIVLHGGEGEDGTVQGVLDTLGITYAGSGVEASAVAMDKVLSKQVWQSQNVSVPPGRAISIDDDLTDVIAVYGPNVMVKPAHEGSSVGMAIARSVEELDTAIKSAQQYDASVLVESLLDGPEYTVAVLGKRCLPAVQLEVEGEFYDYDAKYISNTTGYICPAPLAAQQHQQLAELALQAFNGLGCKGWGRVDIMAHRGDFHVLEVNTVPGMTDHSLVPKAAAAAGLSFQQLVLEILASSLDEVADAS